MREDIVSIGTAKLTADSANAQKCTGPRTLRISLEISVEIPTAQLRAGLLWLSEDSPTKFQKLLEWLELLRACVEAKDYAAAHEVVGWIHGPVPIVRGAVIKQIFCSLAEAGAKAPPDETKVPSLRLESVRQTANIQAQHQVYSREQTELTSTMHEERLAATPKQRALASQISVVDRQTDQKIRLLLALQQLPAAIRVANRANPQIKRELDLTSHPQSQKNSPYDPRASP
jgi:hypothetical protein